MPNSKKESQNIQNLFNFIESLCWLLDSNRDIDFKKASKTLKLIREKCDSDAETCYTDNLIGILPTLLKDTDIFKTNGQLLQFADEVLSMKITRGEKRSRNEIIGLIICEVEETNKERIHTIAMWSKKIMENKSTIRKMQENTENSGNIFSWNRTIQILSNEGND